MPVSHITLTVSHLPTSTSFFLSCLQPLGYQFIGRHDDYIGFGQKQGEPADFWMTETKPGTPPGAVHVAFPAPSKDAVGSFFISALKAGAKIHGEPKERDSTSGYFSAAVVDFDGNSIEAVYRPEVSSAASAVSGPTMALLEDSNRSVVSKASSRASTVKAESVAPRSEAGSVARSVAKSEAKSRAPTTVSRAPTAVSKAPTAVERSAPTVVSRAQAPQTSYIVQTAPAPADDGSKAAKTIVGTLIGAAAGAAIAYAMVKGDSQSTEEPRSQPQQFPTDFPQIKAAAQSFFGAGNNNNNAPQEQEPQQFRAIEAPPPPRSVYSAASGPRSTISRSVTSKNPRASTIYEGTEFHGDNMRRASEGSVYTIPEDAPLRAIEYPPASAASQQRYPCAPSTFISSYHEDMPRHMSTGSVHSAHSASTVKAGSATRRHSTDDRDTYSSVSHRSQSVHSHHSQQSHRSVRTSSHAGKDKDNASVASSKSARNIPLPVTSTPSFYSSSSIHSKDIAIGPKDSYVSPSDHYGPKDSYISARHVLLPESVLDVDVESNVSPDDSISQAGGRSNHSHRSHRSHRSSHSKREPSVHSKSGSKFDEAVRPADSVSQVSRASQRTVKAEGSKAGSKVGGSRRGSQVA
ncbi:unnamed protein product [Penicillium salamii]|nr:unnamed protein product [Penicillium salamii]